MTINTMLFEQYHPQDLLSPSTIDDGVHELDSSLTSLDFYLSDDIDAYLNPIQPIKTTNIEITNDSHNNNSQDHKGVFDFDFEDLLDVDISLDFSVNSIEDIDIQNWISQSSFPSPPSETESSPICSVEDTLSISSVNGDEHTVNADMIVPPSPSLPSSDSSSILPLKKTKLTALERKLRKKSQNKSAAEKYRIKKKSERHQLLERHSKLKDANRALKQELEDLTYRVQQFKQLFVEYLHFNPSISN